MLKIYTGNIVNITNLQLDNVVNTTVPIKHPRVIKYLDKDVDFKMYLEPIIKEELGLTSSIKEIHFTKVFNKNTYKIVFDDNFVTSNYNKSYYQLIVALGNLITCLNLLVNKSKSVITLNWDTGGIPEDWYTFIAIYIVKKLNHCDCGVLNIVTHNPQLIRALVVIGASMEISKEDIYVNILVTKKDKTEHVIELDLNMAKSEILQNHSLTFKTLHTKKGLLDYGYLLDKLKKQERLLED